MRLTKYRISVSATALLLSVASALAGDANTVYLTQDGTGNTASVDQSVGPGGNDFTSLGNPALQDGDNNVIQYSNSTFSGDTPSNNDLTELDQIGDMNWFVATDWGSDNGTIGTILEQGNRNQVLVARENDDGSHVGSVQIVGNSNVIAIRQGQAWLGSGSNNEVTSASITGNGNGNTALVSPYWGVYPQYAGISILQRGNGNTISNASIVGDSNSSHTTFYRVQRLEQIGDNNTGSASTLGSNGNRIWAFQTGDGNDFTLSQGVGIASTQNFIDLIQTGNDNDAAVDQMGSFNVADVDQIGNGNHIDISQYDDNNTVTANFDGNDNGVGTFTGVAATTAGALTPGMIVQDAATLGGNLITYDVFGNSNLFAFKQDGDGNTIDGNVGTAVADASFNQAAVVQIGNNNTASFSQVGNSNNIGITQ